MTKRIEATGFSAARPQTGLKEVITQTRICLKCDHEFESTGASNRICISCNGVNLKAPKRIESGGTHSTRATHKGDNQS